MASDMLLGRSSNRIALQVGRGNEWSPGLASWMTTGGSECFLPTRSGPEIRTRCISKPTDHQQILLEKLRLKLPAKIIQRKM